MSDTAETLMVERPQLSLTDKVATLTAWALAGALFLKVGWFAMEPDDPLGTVSVFGRAGALSMLIQTAALAGVAAGVATLIAGRRLADVGTFAVALGLVLVSLRGGTTEYLLMRGAETSSSFEHTLALRYAAEALGWAAVVIVAVMVSAAVMRWCFGHSAKSGTSTIDLGTIATEAHAGFDIPRLSCGLFGIHPDAQTPAATGLKHTALAVGVGYAGVVVLSAGLASRSVQHGQSCFVIAGASCIAFYAAYRVFPVRSPLWSILAVALVAVGGYAFAALRPATVGFPANIPVSQFMRITPIQFICVGTASVLAAFWAIHLPPLDTRHGSDSTKTKGARRGHR